MTTSLSMEQIDKLKEGFAPGTVGELVAGFNAPLFLAALDLAKIALTPPPDAAELVSELRARKAARIGKHYEHNFDDKILAVLLSLSARNRELEAVLEWYGEQARLARLIHSEGDSGRRALSDDGGKRAFALRRAANLQGNGDE